MGVFYFYFVVLLLSGHMQPAQHTFFYHIIMVNMNNQCKKTMLTICTIGEDFAGVGDVNYFHLIPA